MLSGKRVAEAVRRGGGLIRPRIAAASVAADSHGVVGVGAARGFSASQAQMPRASALPSYVLNCPETQVTTLPNGLRVASEVSLTSVYETVVFCIAPFITLVSEIEIDWTCLVIAPLFLPGEACSCCAQSRSGTFVCLDACTSSHRVGKSGLLGTATVALWRQLSCSL